MPEEQLQIEATFRGGGGVKRGVFELEINKLALAGFKN